MSRVEVCLGRVRQVRGCASDPQSAYLLRTRINRLLLSVQKLLPSVVSDVGDRPEVLAVKVECPADAAVVIALCNEIVNQTRHLSQRSESLDARWEGEWEVLDSRLDRLEQALITLDT